MPIRVKMKYSQTSDIVIRSKVPQIYEFEHVVIIHNECVVDKKTLFFSPFVEPSTMVEAFVQLHDLDEGSANATF